MINLIKKDHHHCGRWSCSLNDTAGTRVRIDGCLSLLRAATPHRSKKHHNLKKVKSQTGWGE